MPQSNEVKKEQARLRMQKMRNKGNADVTQRLEGVTLDVTQYPSILYALTDPEKRIKLEKVYQSLKDFKQEKNVYYGCGKCSIPFDMVGELLETTS